MTLRELTTTAGAQPALLAAALAGPAVAALLTGLAHGKGRGGEAPWKYVYSVLVYAACVPGMLSAVLTAYAIFFTKQNLLDVNLGVYFMPIVAMGVTCALIRRNVDFDQVPGFDRLSGLMTLLGLTFIIVLALDRSRILLVFGGSVATLVTASVACFGLLKWAANAIVGDAPPSAKPDEPAH